MCDCGNEIFTRKISRVKSGEQYHCGCSPELKSKEYYTFLNKYKNQLYKAGILYVSKEQYKNDTIPYWCPVHNTYKLISKASLKRFTVAPCFSCGKVVGAAKKTKTTEQFIKDSISVYGDIFTYEDTVYIGSHDTLTISCKKHGNFTQTATDHLSGYVACKGCSPHCGFDKRKRGELYLTKWVGDKTFIKFGITNKASEERINKQKTRRSDIMYKPELLNVFKFKDGAFCAFVESSIKKSFNTGVVSKVEFPDGFSETVDIADYDNVLKLIQSIKEKHNE